LLVVADDSCLLQKKAEDDTRYQSIYESIHLFSPPR